RIKTFEEFAKFLQAPITDVVEPEDQNRAGGEIVDAKPILKQAIDTFEMKLKERRMKVYLEDVYFELFKRVPWPEPIPRPQEVTCLWNYRTVIRQGCCWRKEKIIEISCLYKLSSLHLELFDRMAHEAAHFIWRGHPKEFKQFLKKHWCFE